MAITIAIPVYNAEKHLRYSIKSILNQNFTDFELLIIDDGSSDDSLNIAKGFDDPRITIYSDGENKGLPDRLNEICNLAKYDIIARMDADDIAHPDRLSTQFQFLSDNPQLDLVCTAYKTIDDNYIYDEVTPYIKDLCLDDMLSGRHKICHPSIMYRKSWLQRNQYNSSMERAEDFELWLRAYINNDLRIGAINRALLYYRADNTLNLQKYIRTYKTGFFLFPSANLTLWKR